MTFAALATYSSRTARVRTPLGNLYVHLARDASGTICRVSAECGKESTGGMWCGIDGAERLSHPAIGSLLDCVTHLVKRLIQSGVLEERVVRMLAGYNEGWPIGYWYPEEHAGDPSARVMSLQDAIGKVIRRDGAIEAQTRRDIIGSTEEKQCDTNPKSDRGEKDGDGI